MSYPTSQSKRRGQQLAAVAGSDKVPSRLPDEVVRTVGGPSLDGTDSASPTPYALDRGREVHGFVVDTDPETGARAVRVVGFDTATPQLDPDFARGAL